MFYFDDCKFNILSYMEKGQDLYNNDNITSYVDSVCLVSDFKDIIIRKGECICRYKRG